MPITYIHASPFSRRESGADSGVRAREPRPLPASPSPARARKISRGFPCSSTSSFARCRESWTISRAMTLRRCGPPRPCAAATCSESGFQRLLRWCLGRWHDICLAGGCRDPRAEGAARPSAPASFTPSTAASTWRSPRQGPRSRPGASEAWPARRSSGWASCSQRPAAARCRRALLMPSISSRKRRTSSAIGGMPAWSAGAQPGPPATAHRPLARRGAAERRDPAPLADRRAGSDGGGGQHRQHARAVAPDSPPRRGAAVRGGWRSSLAIASCLLTSAVGERICATMRSSSLRPTAPFHCAPKRQRKSRVLTSKSPTNVAAFPIRRSPGLFSSPSCSHQQKIDRGRGWGSPSAAPGGRGQRRPARRAQRAGTRLRLRTDRSSAGRGWSAAEKLRPGTVSPCANAGSAAWVGRLETHAAEPRRKILFLRSPTGLNVALEAGLVGPKRTSKGRKPAANAPGSGARRLHSLASMENQPILSSSRGGLRRHLGRALRTPGRRSRFSTALRSRSTCTERRAAGGGEVTRASWSRSPTRSTARASARRSSSRHPARQRSCWFRPRPDSAWSWSVRARRYCRRTLRSSRSSCRGLSTDGRADIYTLGLVAYEMLAGAPHSAA